MDYKATWKIDRKEEYTVDDMIFDTPAKYLSTQWVCPVPVGEPEELDVSLRCERAAKEWAENFRRGFLDGLNEWKESVNDIKKRGEEMGSEDWKIHEIYSLYWDGVEVFNLKKKFTPVNVIFNNPATIVFWADGTKTVVTDMDNVVDGKAKPCEGYSKETGLALCYMKKALGNKGNYNNAFRKWIT